MPPLGDKVQGPPALARRLSQIGVVDRAEVGAELRRQLGPGQRLVSEAGDLWRWDGFTVAAGAPSAAAVRLQQHNRLRDLRARIAEVDLTVETAEERVAQAAAAADVASHVEAQARDRVRQAEAAVNQARDDHGRLVQRASAAASRLAAIDESLERLRLDLAEADIESEAARSAQSAIAEVADDRSRQSDLRAALAESRAALIEARSVVDRLQREAAERRRRIERIGEEAKSWEERAQAARRHQEELAERREEIRSELERLAARPLEIAEQRSLLLDDITAAEAARRRAADALAEAEAQAGQADARRRAAEQALAAAREDKVRREAAMDAGRQACRSIAQAIDQRFECTPEKLAETAGIGDDEVPALEDVERRLDRLQREREGLGAVNLRADTEAGNWRPRPKAFGPSAKTWSPPSRNCARASPNSTARDASACSPRSRRWTNISGVCSCACSGVGAPISA